jgi:hypothetical protein
MKGYVGYVGLHITSRKRVDLQEEPVGWYITDALDGAVLFLSGLTGGGNLWNLNKYRRREGVGGNTEREKGMEGESGITS